MRWSEAKVAQSCPTLCDPLDYTVCGILQARTLEWVAFPFSRGSSQSRDQTQVSALQADSLPAEKVSCLFHASVRAQRFISVFRYKWQHPLFRDNHSVTLQPLSVLFILPSPSFPPKSTFSDLNVFPGLSVISLFCPSEVEHPSGKCLEMNPEKTFIIENEL